MNSLEKKILDASGNDQIPLHYYSYGQGLKMEIVNQYGQLMGEFSRLDDELWLTAPEDDQPTAVCSESLEWKNLSSHLHEHVAVADPPMSECTDNTVTDGVLTSVKNNSSSLKDSSQKQPQALSLDSVLQRRSFFIETKHVMKRARSKRYHSEKKCSRSRFSDTLFQSENHMASFVLNETTDSCPTELVRSRKISDLLRNPNTHARTTLQQNPPMEEVKKCLHCYSTKTPQWSDGPLGQKTLCSACGIQYKKRLLIANYQHSRSPTFDTSLPNVPEKNPFSTPYQKRVLKPRTVDNSEIDHNCDRRAKSIQVITRETSDMFQSGYNLRSGKRVSQPTPRRKLSRKEAKKCQHCKSNRTPQWREGPMGRNTLCNACGVQY